MNKNATLMDPLSGNRTDINSTAGRIAIYSTGGARRRRPVAANP